MQKKKPFFFPFPSIRIFGDARDRKKMMNYR